MNVPIRRLSALVTILFLALLASASWIQVGQAESLRDRAGNRRTALAAFNVERGAVLVGTTVLAESRERPGDEQLRWQRVYPEGSDYAHATGYFNFMYGAGLGVERAANPLLSGSDDRLFITRLRDLVTGSARTGATIELTIDPAMQAAANKALGSRKGAIIAVDASNGEILALVSHPSFDPNTVATNDLALQQAAMEELQADTSRPLTNRALGELYPPGSTFKVITAAAALSSGTVNPDTVIPAPRRLTLPGTSYELPNYGGAACSRTNTQTLADALRTSCNTAFAQLGMDLGVDRVASQAEAFGFGKEFQVPMRAAVSSFPRDINESQLGLSSIGQFDVRVTPLQVAMMSAAVVNEGVIMEPHLIRTVRRDNLEVISTTSPVELSRAVSSDVAAQLRDMMVGVVEDGSGRSAQIRGVTVGGKTGTAEFGNKGRAHAWFTGFVDGERRIAIAVLVEDVSQATDGGTGGRIAAPLARAVIQAGL